MVGRNMRIVAFKMKVVRCVPRQMNAKKRLLNWVQRLMRQNGLDATDLEALFARVAQLAGPLAKGAQRPFLGHAGGLR
jgi:hypothetical protein